MLHVDVIREIRRLLNDEDMSQRTIAARLGVSRGVVGQIASGCRGLYGRDRLGRWTIRHSPNSIPERCPGCGGQVYMPCRLCTIRAHLRATDPRRVA